MRVAYYLDSEGWMGFSFLKLANLWKSGVKERALANFIFPPVLSMYFGFFSYNSYQKGKWVPKHQNGENPQRVFMICRKSTPLSP